MRDAIKNIEYFNIFIDEELQRIDKFSKKLSQGAVKPERIKAVKSKIHDLKLGLLIAKYSRGDELSKLKLEFLDIVRNWKEVYIEDYYNKNLKIISLAVLFNVDSITLRDIYNLTINLSIHDWLIEFLIDFNRERKNDISKKLLFPMDFITLQKVVYEDGKTKLLEKYLHDEWYCEDCGCYDSHKSKQNIYYGYWSFEAGAIAKILKLDDSSLKQTKYYPYDLVHYEG